MKLDFSKTVQSINGEPLKANGKDLTLGMVAREVLLGADEKDAELGGEAKYQRWVLAKQCEGEVEVKTEDVVLIKRLVGKNFTPAVVGPVFDILEGKSN